MPGPSSSTVTVTASVSAVDVTLAEPAYMIALSIRLVKTRFNAVGRPP
jgi:hypothetical protein